jgi:tRNA (cytidine/uridine-2'-O-)-methyltransferase
MFHIVLYEPEIHYNAGNVGRTCVALQAKLWLVRPLGFRLDDQHFRRAGLDYWEHLQWEVVNDWTELEQKLTGCRMWFFTKTAARLYTEVQYNQDDALVFGSETRGLPPAIIAAQSYWCVRIPMSEHVRSLNLAVSAGIAMYEAARQIKGSGVRGQESEIRDQGSEFKVQRSGLD